MAVQAARNEFDYVVVGGGSAGCVAAGRLSADPTVRVLLLERGPDATDDPRLAPPTYNTVLPHLEPLELLPIETLFTREPKLARRFTETHVPRALGGGPAVSGSFWGRGDPSNYDEWARLGNEGWGYEDLLPFFKKSEHYRDLFHPERRVSDERGSDGPIKVGSLDDTDPVLSALLESASRAFGVRRMDDYNTRRGIEGVAPMQRSLGHDVSRPRRSTSYTEYVQPYLASRPNLQVVPMATVTRVTFDAGAHRAEGVEYLHRGEAVRATASREVLLCAGTIQSPKILLQSGVGDPEELRRLGVTPVVDLPGVGRNLHDHIYVHFAYRPNPEKLPPATTESPVLIGFFRSQPDAPLDLEVACGVTRDDVLMGFLVSVRNEAVGRVELASADPLVPPRLELGLDPASPDMDKMRTAFGRVRSWLFESQLVSGEIWPGLGQVPVDADDAQWTGWFSREMKGFFHMAGTCKMAPATDDLGVVDSHLCVRGVGNLRVGDCSVMPRVVASHPSATAVMIGEKLADLVARDGGS